ncbi:MAG: hypothetical protein JNL98_01365 [Bryobacterales bacterium]|nr:hypothetical protein [Bryobacterales bacterium]
MNIQLRSMMIALFAVGIATAQRVAVLEIDVANAVVYRYDVADADKRAVSATPVPVTIDRAFFDYCLVEDIVAINGRTAKGLHMTCATRMGFSPAPRPGFGIADTVINQGRQQCNWELLSADGRFVGRLVDGGFFPHAVLGGAGAYFGLTGEHVSTGTSRSTSVAEDPSMRRINGGGSGKATFYVVPRFWPEIVSQPEGPAVFHGAGFDQVSNAKLARAGELLVMKAKGLGPTLPLLIPPGVKPFAAEAPFEEVNAPVEVTINGIPAEVVSKIGWPGTLDTYRVDFRVPAGVPAGQAVVRLTSAWISSEEIQIRIE